MKRGLLIFFLLTSCMNLYAQATLHETSAEFAGGEDALMSHIMKHLIYPKNLKDSDLDCKIVFTFVVESDGSISNIQLNKPKSPTLEKAIVRMVRSMPKWIPATKNYRAVSSRVSIPIIVCLD